MDRFRRLIDELVETGPIPARAARDWVLAAIAIVAAVVEVAVEPDLGLLHLSVAVATASLVPDRRRYPLFALLAALALHVVLETVAVQAELAVASTVGQIGAGMVLIYTLCRWDRPERVAIGLVLLVAVLAGTELLEDHDTQDLTHLSSWALFVLFALAMRYRNVMVDQRDRRVRLAERHALARDVHDSVAHHVSAIAIQAQAARYVAGSDPEAAASAMARIETAAGQTVDELRRLVGVLRDDDPEASPDHPQSLLDLADPGGQPPVVVDGLHDLTDVAIPLATVIYRIAQEAVTNARRHSRHATMIEVQLRHAGRDRLVLEVVDDGIVTETVGTGYGLAGMRERAAVVGGTVTTGPLSSKGWRVRAVLPVR